MKLQLNNRSQSNLVKSCNRIDQRFEITVHENSYQQSLILSSSRIEMWAVQNVSDLSLTDFKSIAALSPEVVILGSGTSITFPDPALYQPLIDTNIGLEVMDTAAACRTYNVLIADDRNVMAMLIL